MEKGSKSLKLSLKTKAAKMSVGDEEETPLSPRSAMFHEKGFNIHILALIGSKTKVDVEVIKAHLPNTLLKHPRFTSVVVGDTSEGEKMRWVRQANVDPLDHIVVPEIGKEDMANPDKYLEDYLYNLSKTNIDRSKPLWEMHVINLKTSHSEAVVVFRIHHSLGDGTSLISLLLACTRQMADPSAVPTIPATRTHNRAEEAGWTSSVGRRGLFDSIWSKVELCWNTMVDVTAFIATSINLKDTVTPLKSEATTLEYGPRRFVFKTVSLDDIKLIKNAFGGTINDVLLGITEAGLSRYLNRKYGRPSDNPNMINESLQAVMEDRTRDGTFTLRDDEKKNNLPANIRLRSTVIVNTRPSAGIQALADMMEKNTKAEWGNRLGFVLLPFSIALRDDPLDYIRNAKTTIGRKKHSLEALFTFYICKISHKLFSAKTTSLISHSAASNTTLIFSNVVGPMEEIQFFDYPLQFIIPSAYGVPHAVLIHFMSYVDKLTIVLSVDEETVPDGPQLCKDIVDSLTLIKDEVIVKGLCSVKTMNTR